MNPFLSSLARIEWQGLSALPVAVAVSAGVLAVVLWLYPRQVRTLENPWRWLLPGLRAVALVVLSLSLLKPVTLGSRQPNEAGALAVIIDRSQSMGVIDSHRSDADLVRLADGLGLLALGMRPILARRLPGEMQEIRAQIDAIARAVSELRYAQLAGRDVTAVKQRLIEAQEVLQARIADCLAVADAPEMEQIRRHLTLLAQIAADPDQDQWLTRLNEQFDKTERRVDAYVRVIDQGIYRESVQVRAICDELRNRSRIELVTEAMLGETGVLHRIPGDTLVFGFTIDDDLQPIALHSGGRLVRTLALEADGTRSRISGAVPRALERLGGRLVHAVVLLSDGRQVGGPQRVVSSLFSGGPPVFAVLAGPEGAVADTVITRVQIPSSLFVGQETIIRADVRLSGVQKETRTVRLHVAGRTYEQEVALRDARPQTVEFPLTIDQAGIHDIRIEVEPHSDEASLANNTASRRVKVLADRVRVVALAGVATWEFQYLRNLLHRSDWIDLKDAIVPAGTMAGILPQDLLEADVLILADVSVASLNVAQRDAIHRLVSERGGSVILVAGDAHLPLEYGGDVLLQALLPWRSGGEPIWQQWPGEVAGFRAMPAGDPAFADLLRLGSERDINRLWSSLPPMYRILAMPELKPNAQPLLVERDSGLPLLTESRLGAGRVFFAAFNESWRWRYKTGDALHSRFWQQLVRHAAETPYAVANTRYAFDADALSIEPDQPLRLRVKRLVDSGERLRVRIVGDSGKVEMRSLEPVPEDERRAQVVLEPLEAGEYVLELMVGDTETPELILPLTVQPTLKPELLDLSPDPTLLRRLAESTGGMLLTLDSMHQLAPRLQQLAQQAPTTVRRSLWDSPYLFGFVLGCLSLEWALRKRLGLV